MSQMLDCNLMPISRAAGQDRPTLPGLHVAVPPRRPARGRNQDRLILYLDVKGSIPFNTGQLSQILEGLSRLYYDAPGSTTSALRTSAEELNRQLLAINAGERAKGLQCVGLFTQVVFREDQVFMAQSGPVTAFLIAESGVQEYAEPTLSGQGLGIGDSTTIRFTQVNLKTGDALLLSTLPSPSWSTRSLKTAYGQGPEAMRRRLFDRSVTDLSAVLLHIHSGKGVTQIFPFQPPPIKSSGERTEAQPPATGLAATPPKETVAPAAILSQVVVPPPEESKTIEPPPSQQSGVQAGPSGEVKPAQPVQSAPQQPVVESSKASQPAVPDRVYATPAPNIDQQEQRQTASPNHFLAALVTVGSAFGQFFNSLGTSLGKFLAKLFPEELFEIPNAVMAIIAIAVPIVIVTAASMVYFQLGRADQGRALYVQAGDIAVNALNEQDPGLRREALIEALNLLSQAEAYGGVSAAQVAELRAGLYQNLDKMDQVLRVDYQKALLDELEPTTKITRMLTSFDNLYMLDISTGRVLRALETTQGYQLDRNFQCGPEFSAGTTGPLIGIALWPESYSPDADIIGMDAAGNLLFCKPGFDPETNKLTPPPIGSFKQLTGLVMDRGLLYVLDPQGNAVWVYRSPVETKFPEPYLFFDDQIPPMQDVIDLAANFDELYLLHADGHLTLCFADVVGISKTQCTDPQPLQDFRTGREASGYQPESPYSQLYSNPSPDPSLYVLEPVGQSVTHFSFRELGFLQQFSPTQPLNGKATAFTVRSVDRLIYLALGNQVYYGVSP